MDAVAVIGVLGVLYIGGVCLRGAAWLAWWHGAGEAHQYQFYRCHACRRLVTHFHIQSGGCRCEESLKISPARLTRTEKFRALFLPWLVTSVRVRRAARVRRNLVAARAAKVAR